MSVTPRVLVVAPPAIEAAIVSRLRQTRAGDFTTDASGARADTLVFVPRGPRPGRENERLREALTRAATAAHSGIDRTVIVSSAAIYGASPYTPGFVGETWEPPHTHPNSVAAWWRQLEQQIGRIFPAEAATVLRPAPVLDGESYFSTLFRAPIALTLSGHDPSIQLLAVEDLAAAISCVLAATRGGVFNVAPAGVIPLRAALGLASTLRLPLPRLCQRPARRVLAAAGAAWPGDQLEYIRYSATISGDRIEREAGFVPSRSSARALGEFLGGMGTKEDAAEPAFDRFGQDKNYIDAYGATLFTFLSEYYWRIETDGVEAVPTSGRAVLAGPHRGFMPFDGVMLLHLIARARSRYVRFLIHPSLVKFPFLFNFMMKLGGIPACRENADWVLQQDEIAGIFPEGIHGAFTPYREAYRLGKFGRDEFVKIALRNRAPIVPFATVGSAEIFPILGKIRWPWWERWTDWPYLPITATFPLAPVPLPSKWHVRFLPPMHIERDYPPEASEDPRVVREISGAVRARIQGAIDEMVARRRWIFFGSIFNRGTDGAV
ncbi:MAG TPA: 1-acyl-sn-glycerol-3-phosphate acyltransferase [Vicinamibacterales bacterium]|nr:1-acyl-sn-glycerol-3-phosphate acyltransferase [Vicinamibacterales bacterium]